LLVFGGSWLSVSSLLCVFDPSFLPGLFPTAVPRESFFTKRSPTGSARLLVASWPWSFLYGSNIAVLFCWPHWKLSRLTTQGFFLGVLLAPVKPGHPCPRKVTSPFFWAHHFTVPPIFRGFFFYPGPVVLGPRSMNAQPFLHAPHLNPCFLAGGARVSRQCPPVFFFSFPPCLKIVPQFVVPVKSVPCFVFGPASSIDSAFQGPRPFFL